MRDIFMAKGEETLTRIILEHYDKRYIVETPYSDSNLLEDLLDLTYTALLAVGYHQNAITDAMKEFVEEKTYKNEEDAGD